MYAEFLEMARLYPVQYVLALAAESRLSTADYERLCSALDR